VIAGFVCTNCAGALADRDSFYECEDCAARYAARGGIACFRPSERHHGEIPREEMRRLLAGAQHEGWRAAYERALRARAGEPPPAPDRAPLFELLALRGDERVLDFGCGLGAIAVGLAARVAHVVALDAVYESAAFVDIRCRQDRIENVTACCAGDPLELPFPDESFDLVIASGVLEYVPLAVPGAPEEAQRLALESLARVLVPGGRLFLAMENRWGYTRFLGYRDASGLPFSQLAPRPVAAALGRVFGRTRFAVATQGLPTLRRLLAGAGFGAARFFWASARHEAPERFLPLDDADALLGYVRGLPGWRLRERVKRAALAALLDAGALPYLAPDYAVIAAKAAAS
jgi:SAM-dependent methyltransferase